MDNTAAGSGGYEYWRPDEIRSQSASNTINDRQETWILHVIETMESVVTSFTKKIFKICQMNPQIGFR